MKQPAVPPLAERQKPGLSVTLEHERAPGICQACGGEGTERWRECDENDRPTATIVVLCEPCGKRLITPHARLYVSIWKNTPLPGAMAICVACSRREQLRCAHPEALANGGPGIHLTVPKPDVVHINYGGGRGEWAKLYPYEPRECSGRDPIETSVGLA